MMPLATHPNDRHDKLVTTQTQIPRSADGNQGEYQTIVILAVSG